MQFADEAGGSLDEQIVALQAAGMSYIDIRGVDGFNITTLPVDQGARECIRIAQRAQPHDWADLRLLPCSFAQRWKLPGGWMRPASQCACSVRDDPQPSVQCFPPARTRSLATTAATARA